MFRVKISPQAVVTVQSAIPKVVIGLVFVTFSYAIAGLLIDLMYVVIGVVAQIIVMSISNETLGSISFDVLFLLFNGELGGILTLFILHFIFFFMALIWSIFGFMFSSISGFTITAIFAPFIFLVFVLLFLFLIAIYIWNWIKIGWMVIKVTANILIAIIFSPLQITFGLLTPEGGISAFIKNLVSNLAVFPALCILIVVSFIFSKLAFETGIKLVFGGGLINQILVIISSAISLFVPGFSISLNLDPKVWSPPFVSDGLMGLVLAGISLSILMITPKVVELIQGFMTKKGFDYGTAIGQAFGPVKTIGGGAGAAGVGWVGGKLTKPETGKYHKGTWQYDLTGQVVSAVQKKLLS